MNALDFIMMCKDYTEDELKDIEIQGVLFVQFPFHTQRRADAVDVGVIVSREGIIGIRLAGAVPGSRAGRVVEHVPGFYVTIGGNAAETLV